MTSDKRARYWIIFCFEIATSSVDTLRLCFELNWATLMCTDFLLSSMCCCDCRENAGKTPNQFWCWWVRLRGWIPFFVVLRALRFLKVPPRLVTRLDFHGIWRCVSHWIFAEWERIFALSQQRVPVIESSAQLLNQGTHHNAESAKEDEIVRPFGSELQETLCSYEWEIEDSKANKDK